MTDPSAHDAPDVNLFLQHSYPTLGRIAHGPDTFEFVREPVPLPETYSHSLGEERSTNRLLTDTDTTALLVVHHDVITYERYWHGSDQHTTWMVMSVTKSVISALVGIAVDDGLINSVDDPITRYVPELVGTAYDDVAITHVLHMSSGVKFNEDYSDPESDIVRFMWHWQDGLDAFMSHSVNELPPGTYRRYVSLDTQALGMLLTRVTGSSVATCLEKQIWSRIGMEADAMMLQDDHGMDNVTGGLHATPRDLARFGRLYLNNGAFNNEQIIPADWIAESVRCDAPHLAPGSSPHSAHPIGYGYQWWIPSSSTDELVAIGIYNQFIYIRPSDDLLIVKTSANRHYTDSAHETVTRELEHIDFFRAVAAHLAGT